MNLVLIFLLSWALAFPANGAEPDYKQGLDLCKVALDRCEDVNTAHDELSADKDAALKYYREDAEKLRASKDSVLNNPFLYLTLGIVAGAILKGK